MGSSPLQFLDSQSRVSCDLCTDALVSPRCIILNRHPPIAPERAFQRASAEKARQNKTTPLRSSSLSFIGFKYDNESLMSSVVRRIVPGGVC